MNPKKIAIGTQSFLPYTQSWIYRQMRGSQANISLVLCNQKENLNDFPFDCIDVVPDRSLWLRKITYKLQPVLKYFPYYVSVRKWSAYHASLKKHKIRLMHVHFGIMGVELMGVCKALKIPLMVTFHGFDITAAVKRDPSYRKALLTLFTEMTIGVAISHEMKIRLQALGCPEDKLRVSYLGIPVEEFAYTERNSHKGTVRFLHAGRLSGTKGVPDLIRSFSTAFKKEDQVELILIGDGEEKSLVEQAIRQSAVKDKIKYLGKVGNEELMQYRKSCDVFVLNCRTPASNDKEGLPISLLEASSTGLPIVTTRHSGIAEGVIHERTGLLVEEYDNEGLALAMRKMMDQNLRLTYGRQGRKYMEEAFELAACNNVLDALYEEVFASAHYPNNKK